MPSILEPSDSPSGPPPRVWVQPLAVVFACMVALALALFFFDAVTTILLGILAAAIVASTLSPLLKYLPGPRGVAAALLGLALIAAVVTLVLALSWPLAGPVKNVARQWQDYRQKIDNVLHDWSNDLQLQEDVKIQDLMKTVGRFFAGERGPMFFTRSADVVLGLFIWLVFIFIGSIFMLADPPEQLLRPLLVTIAPRHRGNVRDMLNALGPRLRRWVVGTLISMCIVFSASSIGYYTIGMRELTIPLALLAGLAEIVPTVGPACAVVIAILFAATKSGAMVVGVLIVYAIIQSIEAYVILPMIMRGAVQIHPAVTLFSVVLWGKIFGVPGLMLAIPINVTLASFIEYLYVRPRDRRHELAREEVAAKANGEDGG